MNEIKVTGRVLPISEATRKLNPELFGGPVGALVAAERKPNPKPALVKDPPAQQIRQESLAVCVTIIACRDRICDDDNSASGGTKALRDAISQSIGIDDGDKRIRWEYGQCETRGSEGCIVRIEARMV